MTTPEQRSYNMSRIRGKDTKPEMIVRKYLWSHGFRYRLNNPRLPGKPDIVLRKYRTCIFVNGCFWHGHNIHVPFTIYNVPFTIYNVPLDALQNSECCKIPRTNRDFWVKKILRNRARDTEVMRKLAQMGWHTITVWECELTTRPSQQPGKTLRQATLESLAYTLNKIFLSDRKPKKYELEESAPLMVAEDSV